MMTGGPFAVSDVPRGTWMLADQSHGASEVRETVLSAVNVRYLLEDPPSYSEFLGSSLALPV